MKYALINPNWAFDGSIYFGCREPHLPLEYGYAKALLEQAGHEVLLVDGQLEQLSLEEIKTRVTNFQPDFSVITTAPSYLFWRCAPPEVRVPQIVVNYLHEIGGIWIAVGPHGSTTPKAALKKLGVDVVIMGECEEILPQFAQKTKKQWQEISAICYWDGDTPRIQGSPHVGDMTSLPALHWADELVKKHHHHHHRFDVVPTGLGAEMEVSRGCPYHCSFCAKENFRNNYRKRPLSVILEELDGFIGQGVEYIYFIDEIFLPNKELLKALVERPIKFGIQTRIDLWNQEMLDLLGAAGCVSIEAGVESITAEGRQLLDKNCKLSTQQLSDRLIYAKQRVPFVQANLLESKVDAPEAIEQWREYLQKFGVWANKPVPLFIYPGSPEYTKKWGFPDDHAWERAHAHYLEVYAQFSDIQEQQPVPLSELEISKR
ncbi:MAG: TIGR04295 family B12-binding domain-containing radical SAM protein [Mojavia pulchra JT2-VF2]|jgi:B12-binding domain/radical SAM domain protein of rhizo-twelve system|uniref:TIGR04295 family B12-binding domain-containing radical SAM protein n=1 Tax=Mojavia pulchra JT2-VF2 TaxID=287848 RepID=A0A951PX80_9NOST|nr:TIGR04295 family B12-binding domain-containing radical SAM protein [Mojavia pulchra JT2-VF2]